MKSATTPPTQDLETVLSPLCVVGAGYCTFQISPTFLKSHQEQKFTTEYLLKILCALSVRILEVTSGNTKVYLSS